MSPSTAVEKAQTDRKRDTPHPFVIVAFLSPVAAGDEFAAHAWPLHVTVVPPFVTHASDSAVSAAVAAACVDFAPIAVVGEAREFFGRARTVAVTTLRSEPQLLRLHEAVLAAIVPLAEGEIDPRHVRSGYRPHVTKARDGELEPRTSVALDRIAVVDQRPGESGGRRRIVTVARLVGRAGVVTVGR